MVAEVIAADAGEAAGIADKVCRADCARNFQFGGGRDVVMIMILLNIYTGSGVLKGTLGYMTGLDWVDGVYRW